MAFSLVCASWMHYVLDIKSSSLIIQSCNIPLKLNQVIQNPTHANTPTNTLTKTRTNTWPTDRNTPLTPSAIPYTYKLVKHTQLTPTNTPT